ncbi:unnamed protein product [Paramecium primaurelia]|uniref:Uncharacterized protein n=1 Tax=Paramecium primaurelia TaxID=5886 RepID=A0A8S1PTG5_PARPR|nr:unnamed protein product [Paramecium primaurelia]
MIQKLRDYYIFQKIRDKEKIFVRIAYEEKIQIQINHGMLPDNQPLNCKRKYFNFKKLKLNNNNRIYPQTELRKRLRLNSLEIGTEEIPPVERMIIKIKLNYTTFIKSIFYYYSQMRISFQEINRRFDIE